MRLLTLPGGQTVLLAQTIFELPAGQYNDFHVWLLRDSGIGAGAQAVQEHFATVTALLVAGRQEEAADALALLHYAYADTLDRLHPQQLAFGCLVMQVNGQPWPDRSEEGLRRLVELLSSYGLTAGMVEEEVSQERLRQELEAHFPAQASGAEQEALLYYQQQQRRVLALCDYVLSGDERHLQAMQEIDNWLLDQAKPDIYDEGDPRDVLMLARKRFGGLCAALADQGFPRAQELTVFELHSAIEHLTAKHQRQAE